MVSPEGQDLAPWPPEGVVIVDLSGSRISDLVIDLTTGSLAVSLSGGVGWRCHDGSRVPLGPPESDMTLFDRSTDIADAADREATLRHWHDQQAPLRLMISSQGTTIVDERDPSRSVEIGRLIV